MQAYQSAPCPYCGATWNPPGAQTCTNCRNQLPPPQPSYAPPGYEPSTGQPPAAPNQPSSYPYGQPGYPQQPPGYPQQPGYPQGPGSYAGGGQPVYPGQSGQPGQYPGYPAPGYGQYPGYPQPYEQVPGYPGYGQTASAAAPGTTLSVLGQSFTLPFVIPASVLRYQKTIAYAAVGVVALLVLEVGVLPGVAASQVASADQAITAAVLHQSKVDAGFAALLAPGSGSSDLNVLKGEANKELAAVNDALTILHADESALSSVDLRLSVLQMVALPSGGAIRDERSRLKAGLDGLKQADTALTAGANIDKVLLPVYDAKIAYTKMKAAIDKHDLVGAGAPYPEAQQKLQEAMTLDKAAGVPDVVVKEVNSLNDLLNNTESLVQAIQSKDAAGVKKYSDAIQANLKTIGTLSLPGDYEAKTYAPLQKNYDSAIKSLKR